LTSRQAMTASRSASRACRSWSGIRRGPAFPPASTAASRSTPLHRHVDSAPLATQLGDSRWRALLSAHFEAARKGWSAGGREVKTTGRSWRPRRSARRSTARQPSAHAHRQGSHHAGVRR
jgi:hypothetical protein